jgi:hypothetical protein
MSEYFKIAISIFKINFVLVLYCMLVLLLQIIKILMTNFLIY